MTIVYKPSPIVKPPSSVDLETIRLGETSFASHQVRPLVDAGPSFSITGGHVQFNSPVSNDIKLVAAEITNTGIQHAVAIGAVKTVGTLFGEALYHADLNGSFTGGGFVTTINNIC